jgi:hypothetical protein
VLNIEQGRHSHSFILTSHRMKPEVRRDIFLCILAKFAERNWQISKDKRSAGDNTTNSCALARLVRESGDLNISQASIRIEISSFHF